MKPPKVTIMDIIAKPKGAGDEPSGDSGEMAKRALWKAIKSDDYEAFSEALDELTGKDSEPDADVDDAAK